MIKYFKIESSLDTDLEDRFLDTLNKLDKDDSLILWITSSGGDLDIANNLIDIINNDDRIIKVKFYWQVSSCAFRIMTHTPYEKRVINEDVWSILHLYNRESGSRNRLKGDVKTVFLNKYLDKENRFLTHYYKTIGISQDIIDIIETGEDIYLTYDDIIKLKI